MKKLERLIEIKRLIGLNNKKRERINKREAELRKEHSKVLESFTADELRLFKERIARACEL